jgi:hypothetical protein
VALGTLGVAAGVYLLTAGGAGDVPVPTPAAVCLAAQGLLLLPAGLGVLARRRWGRALALGLAGLLSLEGLACLAGAGRHAALPAAGLVLLAGAGLTFVALLGPRAAGTFGAPRGPRP